MKIYAHLDIRTEVGKVQRVCFSQEDVLTGIRLPVSKFTASREEVKLQIGAFYRRLVPFNAQLRSLTLNGKVISPSLWYPHWRFANPMRGQHKNGLCRRRNNLPAQALH